ncbi:small subunit ribosomal protein S27e [Pancytospora philotis]|nr:small subunit ribosomal protein S27e [Pancytospora philotis]
MVSNIAPISAAPFVHKKKREFRHANGYMMQIVCNDCNLARVAYSHSQTNIKCEGCSTLLMTSTGGHAEIVGQTKFKRAEDVY